MHIDVDVEGLKKAIGLAAIYSAVYTIGGPIYLIGAVVLHDLFEGL